MSPLSNRIPSTGPRRRSALVLAVGLAAAGSPVPPAPAGAQSVQDLRHRTTFHESFGYVQSVRELSDGRLLVADPLGGLLVAVDLRTGAMEPVGREGGGPGEWRQPDAVFSLPGDSTLLIDLGNTRLSVLDPAGRFVTSYPIVHTPAGTAEGPGARPGAGVRTPGASPLAGMEIIRPRATDDAGRVYYQGGGMMRQPGGGSAAGSDSLEVKRWDRGEAAPVRLAGLRPPQTTTATTGRSGSGANVAVRARAVPFAPQDDWAVAPDGRVALVRAEPYRVEWLHPDGRVVTGSAVDYRPLPVRTAEKERWLEALGSNSLGMSVTMGGGAPNMQFSRGRSMPGGARGEMEDYQWPDVLPAFRSGRSRVAPNGFVWVERYGHAGSPTLYDVFDRSGTRIAQIRLPADREVIGFGRSAVFAVHVDDVGLYWLEVYDPPR
jgi:hypothetical protein